MRISDWSSDVCSSDLTLSWLGGVRGHRVQALGVEHFGQTGTVQDPYAHHRIDTAAIVAAANAASAGRPIRYLRAGMQFPTCHARACAAHPWRRLGRLCRLGWRSSNSLSPSPAAGTAPTAQSVGAW